MGTIKLYSLLLLAAITIIGCAEQLYSASESEQEPVSDYYIMEEETKEVANYSSNAQILQSSIATEDPEITSSATATKAQITYNPFVLTLEDKLSTFGLDIDAASYTYGRKHILERNVLPPSTSVRVEEYINYFNYNYTAPTSETFALYSEFTPSPFRDSLQILRVALKAKVESAADRVPWNLTFLIDVSGSMRDRIHLVKTSLHFLVDNMQDGDKLSIGTYAGAVRTVLQPTSLMDQDKGYVKGVIDELYTSGGTAMGSGMSNAYALNLQGFITEGVNRVIVCSDGDANIGKTSSDAILQSIKSYTDQGITLSAIGFGIGNYNDKLMENLSNSGDGNYYYVDSEAEARKVFAEDLNAMISIVARDAKIQLEFDADIVKSYRLIGYENRDMADEDFEKDTTDAGEIGSGHSVTALYEVNLTQQDAQSVGTVRLRYKDPDGGNHEQTATLSPATGGTFDSLENSFQLAIIVAEYAEILRGSPYSESSIAELYQMAQAADFTLAHDQQEFLTILNTAQLLE